MDPLIPKDVSAALKLIEQEVIRARAKFKPFYSAHEGYAVILEEVDELWAEVMLKQRNWTRLREEAIQVAAMAVRFITDITNVDDEALIQAKKDAGFL